MQTLEQINQELVDYWASLPQSGEPSTHSHYLYQERKDALLRPLIAAAVANVIAPYNGPPIPHAICEEAGQVYWKALSTKGTGLKADVEAYAAAEIAQLRFLNARMGTIQAKKAKQEEKAQEADKKAADIADRKADRLAVLEHAAAAKAGPWVAVERLKRNLSQTTLAEAIGVSQVSIYRWESSKQLVPADRLEQIAKLFKLPVPVFTAGNTV